MKAPHIARRTLPRRSFLRGAGVTLALPILDTSLVILVRLAEGRPIWRGGRDHLSHRLVYVGLGEHEAVALLLVLAAACAGMAVLVVAFNDALVTGAGSGMG